MVMLPTPRLRLHPARARPFASALYAVQWVVIFLTRILGPAGYDTAASRLLATNQGLCDVVGLELEDIAPAASKLPDVWEKFGQEAGEPNETAFSIYNATSKPLFSVFEDCPERRRRFGSAMQFFTIGDSWELRHMLAAFDRALS